jgi:hypothetical protein
MFNLVYWCVANIKRLWSANLSIETRIGYLTSIVQNLINNGGGGGGTVYSGSGDPNGVVTAPVGSLYVDVDTGIVWPKVSGSGNTGWGL